MKDHLRFNLFPSYMTFGFDMRLLCNSVMDNGVVRKSVAQPAVFTALEEDGGVVAPFLTMDRSDVQDLMDELWRSGFRPSDESSALGEIKAMKYHLEDMRKLVFEHLFEKDDRRA